MLKNSIAILFSLCVLSSCGFKYIADGAYDARHDESIGVLQSNFLCNAKNYSFCHEVLTLLKARASNTFGGIIEVDLSDINNNFTNWEDETKIQKLNIINLRASYTIVPPRGEVVSGYKEQSFYYQFNTLHATTLASQDYSVAALASMIADDISKEVFKTQYTESKL
jgi:hypothetical protein